MTRVIPSLVVFLASSTWLLTQAFHSSPTISSSITRRAVSPTELFMNKKKSASKTKTKTKSAAGGGFGSAFKPQADGFPYAGTIRPGKQTPQRVVLDKNVMLPSYAKTGIPEDKSSPMLPWIIEVKTPDEIEKMRAAGKLAREVLDMAGRAVAVGVTTDEIDALVHEMTIKVGRLFFFNNSVAVCI